MTILFVLTTFPFLPTSVWAQEASMAAAPAMKAVNEAPMPQSLSSKVSAKADAGLQDHKAILFDIAGDVRILKSDAEEWVAAAKDMILEEGDQVLTGKDGHADIAYDNNFLNIARIEKNTKAEFRSIEPTDVYMEDGTVFSALDGLGGGKYQVSTPTAVAGVRGTHLDVRVAGGELSHVAVLQDQKPYESHVEVTLDGEPFVVAEGQQLTLGDGGMPAIKDGIDPAILQRTQNFVEVMGVNFAEPQKTEGSKPVLEPKTGEPALLKEDDSRKMKGSSDGGGNDPGSRMEKMNNLDNPALMPRGTQAFAPPAMDSEMDAFMDALIPPDDAAFKMPGTTGPAGEAGRPEKMDGTPAGPAPGTGANFSGPQPGGMDPRMDMGKAMEFLTIGGMGTEPGPGQPDMPGIRDFAANIMTDFGMTPRDAQQFGTFVEKFSEIGGNFQNFVTPESMPMMMEMPREGMKPEMMGDFQGTGTIPMNPAIMDTATMSTMTEFTFVSPTINFEDFVRFATENQIIEGPIPFNPVGIITTNPFYFKVLEALSADLTATQKASLLADFATNGPGAELLRGNVAAPEIDLDSEAEIIVNVRYFVNHAGVVDATYQKILDDTVVGTGETLQPTQDPPHLILEVQACNQSNPEAGC
jgi:hypothetical protein